MFLKETIYTVSFMIAFYVTVHVWLEPLILEIEMEMYWMKSV